MAKFNMKSVRFGFRRGNRVTRLQSAAGDRPQTDVLLRKENVGYIAYRNGAWNVAFMVDKSPSEITEDYPCAWKWRHCHIVFGDEEAAKDWIRENTADIFLHLRKEFRSLVPGWDEQVELGVE